MTTLKKIFPYILCVFSFLGMLAIIITNMSSYIDSDATACALQALEMHKQHSLLLNTYHESTYIHLHTYAVYVALFFTSNLHYANILGAIFTLILMAICIYYFCRKVLDENYWSLWFIFSFSAISSIYINCYYISNYYTEFVIGQLLVLATFISAIKQNDAKIISIGNKRYFVATLFLLFCFLLLGMRSMQYIFLPLFITILLINWIETMSKKAISATNFIDMFKVVFIIGTFGLISYVLSCHIIQPLFNVSKDFAEEICIVPNIDKLCENIGTFFRCLFVNIDISYGVRLQSIKGAFAIIKFFFLILISFVFPVLQIKRYSVLNLKEKIILIFGISNFILTAIVFIFSGDSGIDTYPRYLLNAIIMLDLIGVQYFASLLKLSNNFYKIIYCFIYWAILTSFSIVSIKGFSSIKMYNICVVNFLKDNDLVYGYASFWNAGVNTYASNDTVKVRQVLLSDNSISAYNWLADDTWYNNIDNNTETFLMLSSDELEVFCNGDISNSVLGVPKQVLEFEDYTIAIYDYNISNYFN